MICCPPPFPPCFVSNASSYRFVSLCMFSSYNYKKLHLSVWHKRYAFWQNIVGCLGVELHANLLSRPAVLEVLFYEWYIKCSFEMAPLYLWSVAHWKPRLKFCATELRCQMVLCSLCPVILYVLMHSTTLYTSLYWNSMNCDNSAYWNNKTPPAIE